MTTCRVVGVKRMDWQKFVKRVTAAVVVQNQFAANDDDEAVLIVT